MSLDGAPKPMLSKNSAFLLMFARRTFSYSDRSFSLGMVILLVHKCIKDDSFDNSLIMFLTTYLLQYCDSKYKEFKVRIIQIIQIIQSSKVLEHNMSPVRPGAVWDLTRIFGFLLQNWLVYLVWRFLFCSSSNASSTLSLTHISAGSICKLVLSERGPIVVKSLWRHQVGCPRFHFFYRKSNPSRRNRADLKSQINHLHFLRTPRDNDYQVTVTVHDQYQ